MKNFVESIEVLKKYNKESFHIEHGITVGLVLGWFAKLVALRRNLKIRGLLQAATERL